MTRPAPILVFDVNETLLDLTTLEPLFESLFGERRAMRDWFAELVSYAQTLTLAGYYRPFNEVAAATLRLRGEVAGVAISRADCQALGAALTAMPAVDDAAPALARLRAAGFRLVTLTNSPLAPTPTPLERAGLAGYFEQHFSVDGVACFKPAPACYQQVADALGVPTGSLCLVACHVWDTLGAQAAGCQGAFFQRPGNAVLSLDGVPAPTYEANDLGALATQLGCAD